jgi:hypothetical protein
MDTTAPTVKINQKSGQTDPTNASPVEFTVVFSEAVSGFVTGDVMFSEGTAPGTLTGTVTEVGPNNRTTYNVAVNGMTGSGTVIATIGTGVARDAAGNANVASSADAELVYEPWHNIKNPLDVDGSDTVEPLDALIIINRLNSYPGNSRLPVPIPEKHPFYDVNNDNLCTPLDVIIIINYFNRATGEGEADHFAGQLPLRAVFSWPLNDALGATATVGPQVPASRPAARADRDVDACNILTPTYGVDCGQNTSSRARVSDAATPRRVAWHSVAPAVDGLLAPLDEILPDLVGDIARVWQTR